MLVWSYSVHFMMTIIEYKHYVDVVYSLRVTSFELRVVSCDFRKINLRVVSSFLSVAK